MIDELGVLDQEFAPWQPKLARVDALRKSIRAEFESKAAEESFTAEGSRFVVELGPKAVHRLVDVAKLVRGCGLRTLSLIASVTLTSLQRAVASGKVSPGVAEGCVTTTLSGPRTIKLFERGTPV